MYRHAKRLPKEDVDWTCATEEWCGRCRAALPREILASETLQELSATCRKGRAETLRGNHQLGSGNAIPNYTCVLREEGHERDSGSSSYSFHARFGILGGSCIERVMNGGHEMSVESCFVTRRGEVIRKVNRNVFGEEAGKGHREFMLKGAEIQSLADGVEVGCDEHRYHFERFDSLTGRD